MVRIAEPTPSDTLHEGDPVPKCEPTSHLDALFRRHHPLLYRQCARWTRGHHADAQDLLAEAYLRAIRAIEVSSTLPDNLLAWVSTVIANLARDHLRAKHRVTRALSDDIDGVEALADPDGYSDERFMKRELLSETLQKVRWLAPTQRCALLARLAGEEYETIAAQLATSPANARKLVQAARHELRAQFAPHELMLIAGPRKRRPPPRAA